MAVGGAEDSEGASPTSVTAGAAGATEEVSAAAGSDGSTVEGLINTSVKLFEAEVTRLTS